MIGGDLAAVGEAGLHRRSRLAVDDRDVMAGAGQIVGGRDADHAGAEDEDLHALFPGKSRMERVSIDFVGAFRQPALPL